MTEQKRDVQSTVNRNLSATLPQRVNGRKEEDFLVLCELNCMLLL